MERRLTIILAADVVGYSRLMSEDEAGTLVQAPWPEFANNFCVCKNSSRLTFATARKKNRP